MSRDYLNFFEIQAATAFDVKPEQALAYFRGKGLRPSFHHRDLQDGEHATSFTVAKMMDVDMLRDMMDSLDQALSDGVPFREWADRLIPTLQARGWWGRQAVTDPVTGQTIVAQLGSPWRLQTIFRTNLQSAYAAGQWAMISEQAEDAPYLLYDAVDDFRTRPKHKEWDGLVLPVTAKFWRDHMPLNGYNCRCGAIQLSADDLEEMGLRVSREPRIKTELWTNPRTGEKRRVPVGIDPGFDHNPGMMRESYIKQVMAEKLQALPEPLRKAAEKGVQATELAAAQTAPPRTFDASTPSGKWHVQSWNAAPEWMRPVLLDNEAVQLTRDKGGAYAQSGRIINMDRSYSEENQHHQDVWRHEFGHIIDVRLGGVGYRSAQSDFTWAMQDDAKGMSKRLHVGIARSAKANRADYLSKYEQLADTLTAMTRDDRMAWLRERAKAVQIDLEELRSLLRIHTTVVTDGLPAEVRIARLLQAIESGDGERFVHYAVGMDAPWNEPTAAASYRKGALSSLSDLIGAVTKNRLANAADGYWGHSNAYYNKRKGYGQQTEAFANLTALAAGETKLLWELAKRFAPRLTKVYQEIITNAATQ